MLRLSAQELRAAKMGIGHYVATTRGAFAIGNTKFFVCLFPAHTYLGSREDKPECAYTDLQRPVLSSTHHRCRQNPSWSPLASTKHCPRCLPPTTTTRSELLSGDKFLSRHSIFCRHTRTSAKPFSIFVLVAKTHATPPNSILELGNTSMNDRSCLPAICVSLGCNFLTAG